jgi:4-oxalocrotonate tautomerase
MNREGQVPFVNIRIVKEVIASDPAGKKGRIATAVKNAIREETGVGDNDVWVVFEEVAARDWYVGETSVEAMRAGGKPKPG